MWLEVFLIGVIFAAVFAIVFFVFFLRKPYRWKKDTKGGSVVFVFEPGKDIRQIELVVGEGKEAMIFRRKNLKKGEKVEFVYAVSAEPARLIVDDETGRKIHAV